MEQTVQTLQTEHRTTVHRDGNPVYDILIESSFKKLAGEMKPFDLSQRKLCIVTDSTVAPLYLDEVEQQLTPLCSFLMHVVIPAGEEYKNLDTVKSVYEALIQARFDRKDMLVALGGGVVGDLCGFTAATYLRGISFVQIPTTLLSQVDSSIGGKTGVDFDSYKNMVGAFHMPRLVYTNVETLKTLTNEQFTSGMGEIIKHGLIKDPSYYRWLAEHRQEIMNRDFDICREMIERSDEIKRLVVEEDPTEQGERALLNFGHTLGHAVEKLKNFTMLHGHCVGLGCISAAAMSARRGWIRSEELAALRQLMEDFEMPVSVSGLSVDEVIDTTGNDKKMDGGVIKFILLRSIGQAVIDREVTADEMRDGLSEILKGDKNDRTSS